MGTRPPHYYFYSLTATNYKKGSYVATPCVYNLEPYVQIVATLYMQVKSLIYKWKCFRQVHTTGGELLRSLEWEGLPTQHVCLSREGVYLFKPNPRLRV